jgi:alkylation response protein AidB-like acyl-CoA dehydrogenase
MISSDSLRRRIIHLARDYAQKRTAFGRYLIQHPIHLITLAHMEITCRAHLHLTLTSSALFGKSEVKDEKGEEDDGSMKRADSVLRLLTPVGKLFTSKEAAAVIAEGMECFGGAGYMEDTGFVSSSHSFDLIANNSGIPMILRDQIVNTIWEGTTNVLSDDVLRVLERSHDSFTFFCQDIQNAIDEVNTFFYSSFSPMNMFSARLFPPLMTTLKALCKMYASNYQRICIRSLKLKRK